jgi:hypothetical protein
MDPRDKEWEEYQKEYFDTLKEQYGGSDDAPTNESDNSD